MTRTVFSGGRVFDGTGRDPAQADVAIEDGRIVDVGSGLDGDVAVDVTGRTILPGLFDCHTHVCLSHVDLWRHAQTPFSAQFYEAAKGPKVYWAAPGGHTGAIDAAPQEYERRVVSFFDRTLGSTPE